MEFILIISPADLTYQFIQFGQCPFIQLSQIFIWNFILSGVEQVEESKRAIITVLGNDRVGIIYGISGVLANNNVNILDISQTILQEFFTMVMVVDVSQSLVEFSELKEQLASKGKEMGLQVNIQHEDIFKYMHRI
jgi:ACT domain-containing protein